MPKPHMDRSNTHSHTHTHTLLTVADFLMRHVVAGGEAVLSHGHVGVEGQRQGARGRLDLWRDPCTAVPANQRAH